MGYLKVRLFENWRIYVCIKTYYTTIDQRQGKDKPRGGRHSIPDERQATRQNKDKSWETRPETRERQDQGGGQSIPDQMGDKLGDKTGDSTARRTQHPSQFGRQDRRQDRRQEKDKTSEADTASQTRWGIPVTRVSISQTRSQRKDRALHCPFASIEDSKPALHSHSLEYNICIPEQPMKKHWYACVLRSAQFHFVAPMACYGHASVNWAVIPFHLLILGMSKYKWIPVTGVSGGPREAGNGTCLEKASAWKKLVAGNSPCLENVHSKMVSLRTWNKTLAGLNSRLEKQSGWKKPWLEIMLGWNKTWALKELAWSWNINISQVHGNLCVQFAFVMNYGLVPQDSCANSGVADWTAHRPGHSLPKQLRAKNLCKSGFTKVISKPKPNRPEDKEKLTLLQCPRATNADKTRPNSNQVRT